MCGRYVVRRIDAQRLGIVYADPGFEEFDERRVVPRFNIAPSQVVPVVRLNREGRRVLSLIRWGLIPHWTRGKPKSQPINARAETVATSGMFRQAFERRRCLIPADGFYEWKKLGAGKQPNFIHLKNDESFAFAGVWERWRPDDDAEPVDTCTIITTGPNEVTAPIHDRMPAILAPADYEKWLSRETPIDEAWQLLQPFDANLMEAYPVSTQVNRPANEGPELIGPDLGD
jgi:putative SOS response-associated peptidase YedK